MLRLVLVVLAAALFGCVGTYDTCTDADDDGFSDCVDCNDQNPAVHPDSGDERFGCNGRDDNCDGRIDESGGKTFYEDADGDGFGDRATSDYCNAPAGYVTNDDDCDDEEPSAHPGGVEICDGIDNDCTDGTDVGVPDAPLWYVDVDGDGSGDAAVSEQSCDPPTGYVANADDCDDTNGSVTPGLAEVCQDGLDNDCQASTPDTCDYTAGDPTAMLGGGYGHQSEQSVGASLDGLGDVDQDGVDDVIVSAGGTGASPPGAFVLLGPVNGMLSLGSAAERLTTGALDDQAGAAVAGPGDTDGDGYADAAFGAPGATDDAGLVPGSAWLLRGPEVDCSPFCDGAVFVGDHDGERVGAALVGPGDLDGDGLDELAVGAPEHPGGGAVFVLADAPVGDLGESDANSTLTGEGSGQAGGLLFRVGDVDADGLDDLGVGDLTRGVLWVVTGAPTGARALADSAVRVDFESAHAEWSLGSAVADDLDGDGIVDLLVSGGVDRDLASDAVAWGELGPLSGSLALDDLTLTTGGLHANAGVRLASLGDLDHDGAGDLALVANAGAGLASDLSTVLTNPAALWYRPGPLSPGSTAIDAGSTVFIHGSGADLRVAAGGDLDGDFWPDVVVGDPLDDTDSRDAGAFWVYSGASIR